MGFILCAYADIVHDEGAISKVRSSDHRMLRSHIILNVPKERRNLVRNKPINEFAM